MGVGEERIWAREAEESTLLKAVAGERLVKSLQAGEDIACKLWKSTTVLQLFVITTCKWSINRDTIQTPSIITHTRDSIVSIFRSEE
jgi:hypothetical protein